MTNEGCTPFRENIAAYTLGALDTDEIPALEAHLMTCVDCRAELEQYQAVSDGLMLALPPQMPPLGLRGKLKSRLTGTMGSDRVRERPAWSIGRLAWGAAFTLLLAINLFMALQLQSIQRQQAELTLRLEREQSVVALLAYPDTQMYTIKGDIAGIKGSLLANNETTNAVMLVWNLPELERGQTYQVWLIDPQGNRMSGGLFVPQSGQTYTTAAIQSQVPLSQFVGIGVTVEPQGGSPGPTGERVLKVDF